MKKMTATFTKIDCLENIHRFALMDGTLLELAFCPHTDDFSNYHDRKFQYSLTDKKEIIYYLAGFSGSAHNNRVLGKYPHLSGARKRLVRHRVPIADTVFTLNNHCIPLQKCCH
jgi:hypothetical protein